MSDPRSHDPLPAGILADFGPAEFLVEPLATPPRRAASDARDPFAALNAMTPDERVALFT